LITDTENLIVEESKQWSASSGSTSKSDVDGKEEGDADKSENKNNEHNSERKTWSEEILCK